MPISRGHARHSGGVSSREPPRLIDYAVLVCLLVLTDVVAIRVADAVGKWWVWPPVQLALLLPLAYGYRRWSRDRRAPSGR